MSVPIGLPRPDIVEPLPYVGPRDSDRKASVVSAKQEVHERTWGLAARTDSSVSFEEYVYWAKIEREIEAEENKRYLAERGGLSAKRLIKDRFKGSSREKEAETYAAVIIEDSKKNAATGEKEPEVASEDVENPMRVTDEEWRNAARALKTAGWGTIFYLVTTDILGWSSTPFVFSSVGFGPGVALFLIFGAAAGFAAYAIWKTFLGLDSARYPVLSFGDPFLRLFGPWARHGINFMQAIQMFLSVAVVVLGNSLLLEQIAQNKLCFVVSIVIIVVVGMASGYIRKLSHIGWFCNAAVWLNIANFIIIMVAAVNFPPDYEAVFGSTLIKTIEPVRTFAGPPPDQYQQQVPGFASQYNAINDMVYSYSGALLFVAFLAEMRHPMDFWKGVFLAQAFICFVYIFFGAFTYGFYGQYAIFNITQVMTPYGLQTAGNVLSLLVGWLAVFLYFNIGLKTVYLEVFQEVLHFPPITSNKGKYLWWGLGPLYWALAFVLAAGVPNLGGIVSFVGGLFSLNFTYSLPGIMLFAYNIQAGAIQDGEGFDPATREVTRFDSGIKRHIRGFMSRPWLNSFTFVYILAALASSGMGTWAGIEGLISIFGPGGTIATNFGCTSPV